MWYVYFLHLRDGDIYVGSTNDLRRRIASHEQGQATSTKAYLPVTLKSYIAVKTEKNARELEKYSSPDQARHSQRSGFGSDARTRCQVGIPRGRSVPDCLHRHPACAFATATAGAIEARHIAFGAFLNGTYGATEFAVRRTIIAEVAVPRTLYS